MTPEERVVGVVKELVERQKQMEDWKVEAEKLLGPVLSVLNKEDVTVSDVYWGSGYNRTIHLKPEMKLTKTAFDEIVGLLRERWNEEPKVTKQVFNGYVKFGFANEDSSNTLDISNGTGTCAVRLTDTKHHSYSSTSHTYEVADGCSGMELG